MRVVSTDEDRQAVEFGRYTACPTSKELDMNSLPHDNNEVQPQTILDTHSYVKDASKFADFRAIGTLFLSVAEALDRGDDTAKVVLSAFIDQEASSEWGNVISTTDSVLKVACRHLSVDYKRIRNNCDNELEALLMRTLKLEQSSMVDRMDRMLELLSDL